MYQREEYSWIPEEIIHVDEEISFILWHTCSGIYTKQVSNKQTRVEVR